jgi:hypothetical protein
VLSVVKNEKEEFKTTEAAEIFKIKLSVVSVFSVVKK